MAPREIKKAVIVWNLSHQNSAKKLLEQKNDGIKKASVIKTCFL